MSAAPGDPLSRGPADLRAGVAWTTLSDPVARFRTWLVSFR